MRVLLLHALVLALVLGVPALARWCDYRYELSTRWRKAR